ncbi:MAG TPA: hypothetical protein VMJ32_14185 [Pirellulales bacterium]|nr:hypothetical protein [Pirellulales bacterium]
MKDQSGRLPGSQAIRRWAKQFGIETLYIAPGSLWENGYAKSFHSRLGSEFLGLEELEFGGGPEC